MIAWYYDDAAAISAKAAAVSGFVVAHLMSSLLEFVPQLLAKLNANEGRREAISRNTSRLS